MFMVTDAKSDDVGEGDDNIDGKDQRGHGNDDNADEAKNVPGLAVGTKLRAPSFPGCRVTPSTEEKLIHKGDVIHSTKCTPKD